MTIGEIIAAVESASTSRTTYTVISHEDAPDSTVRVYVEDPLNSSVEKHMYGLGLPLRRYGFDMLKGRWYMVFEIGE